MSEERFLKNHMNVAWLRPASALWDAVASGVISKYEIKNPSLDLGCGNGIFSFITAGGSFSIDYDWYIDAKEMDVKEFDKNKDVYDAYGVDPEKYIVDKPRYKFTYGLDHKANLLEKAKRLHLYENVVVHDANKQLPFEDSKFETVFSNILYWLNDPKKVLTEINRILKKGGKALLCLPDKKFREYCFTYKWEEMDSALLKKLNRGRSGDHHWMVDYREFEKLAEETGFNVKGHERYLSKLTLMIWDIGLRPVSPLLIKMANKVPEKDRREIKKEWIENMIELASPLYEMDMKTSENEKGFYLFVLEKR